MGPTLVVLACHPIWIGLTGTPKLGIQAVNVTFFLTITVHVTDYHWDRHLYFVIHSYHAQTMTHS
jgi:hypothetical protein